MTPIESVNAFFDRGAQLIHLKDEMYDVLKTSYREVQVQVPVRMDDGSLRVFTSVGMRGILKPRPARLKAAFGARVRRAGLGGCG